MRIYLKKNLYIMNLKYRIQWLIPVLAGGIFLICSCSPGANEYRLPGPDGNIVLYFRISPDSTAHYRVEHRAVEVLRESGLGIVREDADFGAGLVLDSVSDPVEVRESYRLITGKKREVSHASVQRTMHLHNREGKRMDIVFRAFNDGAAFRYVFPGVSQEQLLIEREYSGFHFPPDTRATIQPMAVAGTGWCQTQPSYEEFYEQDVLLDSLPESEAGWVMPALFRTGDSWVLVSETGLVRNYCGSRLLHETGTSRMTIGLPGEREAFPGQPAKPVHTLPWETPWRIMAIGGLNDIVESTLGTDLANPAAYEDVSWIRPGRASWSWVLLKDDSITFPVQKKFIDYAAEMGWEYCLVDVDWDTRIGYPGIGELARYATRRGVGLLLWYNSSGDWNSTVYHPKSRLLTHGDRMAEFTRLKETGISGIKVDFFGGDGSSMIGYYQDIFEDAAKAGLLVNCHGATIPRGWQRTYPNLVTMESVRGFEYVTFEQSNADRQPVHCCILPFTRNVFDPMDFTPVCFSGVPGLRRVTTAGFELALSVIFWSGVQHFAEVPEGMEQVPLYVKEFMKSVPVTWDDVRFMDGDPGKLVVLARRSGPVWYVAGINGEDREKTVNLQMDLPDGGNRGELITDGEELNYFRNETVELLPGNPLKVTLKPHGGFVIRLSPSP